jgi:DNA-binding NarL/FixJ family response regulator
MPRARLPNLLTKYALGGIRNQSRPLKKLLDERDQKAYFPENEMMMMMIVLIKSEPIKTHSFETKLDILKCIDDGEGHGEITHSLGLSHSTVSTIVKN